MVYCGIRDWCIAGLVRMIYLLSFTRPCSLGQLNRTRKPVIFDDPVNDKTDALTECPESFSGGLSTTNPGHRRGQDMDMHTFRVTGLS